MRELTEAEKQLLLAAGWLRSRYGLMMGLTPESRAHRKNLEAFGATWIGRRLVDWTDAYRSLIEEGLLREESSEYFLTERGEAARRALEVERPLWLYEYDNFFARAAESRAHARFCERVYGENLCQHGLADAFQLSKLLEVLGLSNVDSVLDLGCGNGLITEHVSDLTGASFVGLDISVEAIEQARRRTRDKAPRLSFRVGNMNRLDLPRASFDAVVSIDTLYYVNDLEETLRQIGEVLKHGGRMGLFFTQWITDLADAGKLRPENTDLARVLANLGMEFTTVDLTAHEAEHWRKKLLTLEEMRPEFESEGNAALYNYRHSEAARYANWDLQKRSRHLYLVRVP